MIMLRPTAMIERSNVGIVGGIVPGIPATSGQLPPTPSRIRVGGGVEAANLIKKIVPMYPPEAKAARISGRVRFTALIAKDGSVSTLQLVEGPALLVDSARQAVSQWQYRPTLLNGNPVEVITQIDVNYTLSQ
jgi:periplasmic protein TonB